jgi:two-component system, OmpR family, copper resistance phosphate regulon response regulator CusR
MGAARILIAEDEEGISSFLESGLRAAGFAATVVEDGSSALIRARTEAFDLLVLDLGLPTRDGLSVLEELRREGNRVPVIILTARSDLGDKVAGLDRGADDYVTKPFRFEELLARIRARLRGGGSAEEHELRAGDAVLDLLRRRARVGERDVELSAREFALAEVFFRNPGQVLSREQLLSLVWGYDRDPGSNVVDVYVGYLRRKLGDGLIETVRGMGYRLQG